MSRHVKNGNTISNNSETVSRIRVLGINIITDRSINIIYYS